MICPLFVASDLSAFAADDTQGHGGGGQAQRISDYTAFFNIRKNVDDNGIETRWGELVEFGRTEQVFQDPANQETADYIAGRFG